jgi:hypothetical protein
MKLRWNWVTLNSVLKDLPCFLTTPCGPGYLEQVAWPGCCAFDALSPVLQSGAPVLLHQIDEHHGDPVFMQNSTAMRVVARLCYFNIMV